MQLKKFYSVKIKLLIKGKKNEPRDGFILAEKFA